MTWNLTDWLNQARPARAELYQYRTIPETIYGIRVWPGSYEAREWVFEFVRRPTANRQEYAIVTPTGVEVYHVPNPQTPWVEAQGSIRMYPLQTMFREAMGTQGTSKEEFYVLRDGESCLILLRDMHKSVGFTAPIRPALEKPSLPDGHHYELQFE